MKKKTGNNIRLGLFVSICVFVLIVGIYYVGQRKHMFSDTFKVSVIFTDITGLQVGNNVRFSGINVGVIDNIEQITDSTVKVDILIEEKMHKFIRKDAIAQIGSDGLMGNKIITISHGTPDADIIEDDDVIASAKAIAVDDIMMQLKVTTENMSKITADLADITGTIRSGEGTIGKLLMDTTFAETIESLLMDIKKGANGFKRNMDAASKSVFLRGKIDKDKKKNK